MESDEHRRNILIITATITAIILLVAANIAHILMTPDDQPDDSTGMPSIPAPTPAASASESSAAPSHQKPLEVCEQLAPKATIAYTTKNTDRDTLLKQYFTDDAQGLNIPASRIQPQPDVTPAGGMQTGDATRAVCSVWTGLESPWTLTWRWDEHNGWKCTAINGPLDGAYTTLGSKAPKENADTK